MSPNSRVAQALGPQTGNRDEQEAFRLAGLIDIGVNFHARDFAGKAQSLVERALSHGVSHLLATGVSLDSSVRSLAIADAHPDVVWATAGVHPHKAQTLTEEGLSALKALWEKERVVAVGECGLDYYRMYAPKSVQCAVFDALLEASAGVQKPLFLHCRAAHDDFLAVLGAHLSAQRTGVVHCFTGTREQARAYLDAGLDIGITGWLSDSRRAHDLRDAVQYIPLDRLHIETDAPYLTPKNGNGLSRINEPANLCWVLAELALLKKVSIEQMAAACSENSRRLFRLSGGSARQEL